VRISICRNVQSYMNRFLSKAKGTVYMITDLGMNDIYMSEIQAYEMLASVREWSHYGVKSLRQFYRQYGAAVGEYQEETFLHVLGSLLAMTCTSQGSRIEYIF